MSNLIREAKPSGANENREKSISTVQLTMIRIGTHTWLMRSLLKVLSTHTQTQLVLSPIFRHFGLCVLGLVKGNR